MKYLPQKYYYLIRFEIDTSGKGGNKKSMCYTIAIQISLNNNFVSMTSSYYYEYRLMHLKTTAISGG